jgi:membrane protease YdiL (CAAX protease family)
MTTIKALIKRHPLLSFFALAFVISWGAILLVVGGPGGIVGHGEQLQIQFVLVFLANLAGPPIAGILLTAILDGGAGLRGLFSRMVRWRVGIRWYAVALFTTPVLATVVLSLLSLISPDFIPGILTSSDRPTLLLFGVLAGLLAGFFEEIGWTGFAVPRLLVRHSILATGLMLGAIHGVWHFGVELWGSSESLGAYLLPHIILFWILALMAYRVLMVWVYEHTESLLLAQIMHAFLPGTMWILGPIAASAAQTVLWQALFAVALWAVVAIVVIVEGRQFVRDPLRRRVA